MCKTTIISYGAFLDLRDRLCIVVGGGAVAYRKISKLLDTGAHVRAISPSLRPEMQKWVEEGRMEWVPREYRSGDLREGWLVFAATDSPGVNSAVKKQADRLKIFANVVNKASMCSLIVPATVRRGHVQVAISTSGISPTVAKNLRQALDTDMETQGRTFQEEIEKYVTSKMDVRRTKRSI